MGRPLEEGRGYFHSSGWGPSTTQLLLLPTVSGVSVFCLQVPRYCTPSAGTQRMLCREPSGPAPQALLNRGNCFSFISSLPNPVLSLPSPLLSNYYVPGTAGDTSTNGLATQQGGNRPRRKQRHRECKRISQGHTPDKCQNQDLNSDLRVFKGHYVSMLPEGSPWGLFDWICLFSLHLFLMTPLGQDGAT